jgi:hypothetical protein
MKRIWIVVAVFAILAASCSSGDKSSVASLNDDTPASSESDSAATPQLSDEETILEFAACMRENGVEDFEDPDVDANGGVQFRFGGQDGASDVDRETMQAAFEVCGDLLGAVAFGGGGVDRSEIEDQLYEFAACMRDNGIDMDDPSFAGGPGQGGGAEPGEGGGPFGDSFDPSDPETAAALEVCQSEFGGFGGPGGGPGGGPPGGNQGGQGQGPGEGNGGQNG